MNEEIKHVPINKLRRRTAISFIVFGLLLSAGIFAFNRLYHQPLSEGYLQPGLRRSLQANEWFFEHVFSKGKLTKSYDKQDAAKNARVNGHAGMDGILDTNTWRLKVARAPGDTLTIDYHELLTLPKTEVVFDFKCVEGWDQVTWWSGVRFADFLKKYNLEAMQAKKYVGLITPDRKYFVGIDMASMMQPQTLLCYELNGKVLPQEQGYPLRLIIPVKYGIKHLKRIGTLYFSDIPPRDYWAEQGYDYYAGL